MPTKQDIITWLAVALICVLFFMLGCIRENNVNSHINAKINSNGRFILCDTTNITNCPNGW